MTKSQGWVFSNIEDAGTGCLGGREATFSRFPTLQSLGGLQVNIIGSGGRRQTPTETLETCENVELFDFYQMQTLFLFTLYHPREIEP